MLAAGASSVGLDAAVMVDVRITLGHVSRTTGRSEPAPFATERNKLLVLAGLTSSTQESVFKKTILRIILDVLKLIGGMDRGCLACAANIFCNLGQYLFER